jgi:hypothetical protein
MESNEALDVATARAELAALADRRAALADRVVQPWWYDVSLGVLMAGFLSTYSTRSAVWITVGLVVFMAGCLGLVTVYKRRTGLWLSGNRPGPTRAAIRAFTAVYALAIGGGALAEFLLEIRGAMVLAGIVAGVGVALASRWWTRIYVAELRGEA